MRALFAAAFFSLGVASGVEFPVKDALNDAAFWVNPEFVEKWNPATAATEIALKTWPQPGRVFGHPIHEITAAFQGNEIRSITLLFLDSGTHFGYVAPENADQVRINSRDQFIAAYEETSRDVRAGLIRFAANPDGITGIIGKQPRLKQRVKLFQTGNVTARLHLIPEQLVKVTLFPNEALAKSWGSARWLDKADKKSWAADFETRVKSESNGDRHLTDIPIFPQGNRAYCGVSSMAMVSQYLGLHVETEDLAAAAGIRYGSTKGSKILETYQAATYELGMRLPRKARFDFEKVQTSIDAGLPVLVWRRWRKERDYLHTQFAKRFAKKPDAELPVADEFDREQWPQDDDFNHASVVTGYNLERGEVIFMESWGEHARNRRMRVEEMEGTVYYSFYPAF